MRNAMQLKAVIKNIAKEKHISAQLVMQNRCATALAGYRAAILFKLNLSGRECCVKI